MDLRIIWTPALWRRTALTDGRWDAMIRASLDDGKPVSLTGTCIVTLAELRLWVDPEDLSSYGARIGSCHSCLPSRSTALRLRDAVRAAEREERDRTAAEVGNRIKVSAYGEDLFG